MADIGPGMRRVSVYAEDVGVDVTLSAAIPIAELMPSVVEILVAHGYRPDALIATPYRLAPSGAAALDASMTLAQSDIRDGSVLVMTRAAVQPPRPALEDAAEAVAAAVAALTRPVTVRWRVWFGGWLVGMAAVLLLRAGFAAAPIAAGMGGIALLSAMTADEIRGAAFALCAAGLAAVAGFVTVPEGPGPPNVLLASVAAATVAVLEIRLLSCGEAALTALTAVAGVAALCAVAALAAVLTAVPFANLCTATAAVSVGLLQISTRAAVGWTGLAPPIADAASAGHLDAGTRRAHCALTGLVVATSTVCALGAVGAAATARAGIVVAAAVGAVLMLRARTHADQAQALALGFGGVAALTASTAATAIREHPHPLVNCAAALGLTTLSWCACRSGSPALSPITWRAVQGLEYLALAAIAPLTCWTCGLFAVVRGLDL